MVVDKNFGQRRILREFSVVVSVSCLRHLRRKAALLLTLAWDPPPQPPLGAVADATWRKKQELTDG